MLEQENLTCTDTGASCNCTGSQEEVPEEPVKTQPYTVNGGTITLGNESSQFCVQGDELRILSVDAEDDQRLLVVFKRQ